MAFRAMCHHTLRSLLTLLGIVIGITGIIAISAIGKGAQIKARDQWLAYGAKSVFIQAGNWMSGSGTGKPPKPLTIDDIDIIKTQCPAVQYITGKRECSFNHRKNLTKRYLFHTTTSGAKRKYCCTKP
jgi:putative ABC transport system permease protein